MAVFLILLAIFAVAGLVLVLLDALVKLPGLLRVRRALRREREREARTRALGAIPTRPGDRTPPWERESHGL